MRPTRPPLLLAALLVLSPGPFAADWRPSAPVNATADDRMADSGQAGPERAYAQRTAVGADGKRLTAHLAFFGSRAYRIEVLDLGADPPPDIGEALRAAGCMAGVNGGFFHPDYRPLGLVIAGSTRYGAFSKAKLLSGVLYGDDRGIHLVRRAAFRDHPGIRALLQTGPYLVERGTAVRGLSDTNPARRTFIATDWRRNWVIGATASAVTLDELAGALASPGALTSWPVDRAINLDGGSSTGFYFAPRAGQEAVTLRPLKRVRNLLCVAPR
jgi:hypothetical protein